MSQEAISVKENLSFEPVTEAPLVWVAQINRIEGAHFEVERAGQDNRFVILMKERK